MPFLDTNRQRAAMLIALLGAGIAIALAPFATGLIGGVVLYVTLAPVNDALRRRVGAGVAAGLLTALAVFLVLVPGLSFAGIIVGQAQQIASGVIQSPILRRLSELQIGEYHVGPRLAELGENVIQWLGSSAFGLIGTATRLALNLTIAFFGLYFLLLRPQETWELARPYIPFSAENAEKLRRRFRDVTASTMLGTLLIALVQGLLIALAFWFLGLPSALFWGFVTMLFAILPLVGSGLVWGPGAIALALDGRLPATIGLVAWGVAVVGMVDNVLRPVIYRRWASIHPLVTLVGAIAGVRYFGVLGILIGPLSLSYFFELIRMYREEYVERSEPATGPEEGRRGGMSEEGREEARRGDPGQPAVPSS
ncbi:MAG TPA: AI-2E family transporter [Gemmatimonadales bacterium]|nr:AI-2E family transporter [Gemmatimonadales bacterium]